MMNTEADRIQYYNKATTTKNEKEFRISRLNRIMRASVEQIRWKSHLANFVLIFILIHNFVHATHTYTESQAWKTKSAHMLHSICSDSAKKWTQPKQWTSKRSHTKMVPQHQATPEQWALAHPTLTWCIHDPVHSRWWVTVVQNIFHLFCGPTSTIFVVGREATTYTYANLITQFVDALCHTRIDLHVRIAKVDRVRFIHRLPNMMTQLIAPKKINTWVISL